MKKYFFYTILCVLFFACKKHMPENQTLWECNSSIAKDSATIIKGIIGTWKLKAAKGGNVAGAPALEIKDVILTFNSNSNYIVTGDSLASGSGKWNLVFVDSTWLKLECSPANMYLNGSLIFCDDKLIFSNSPFDGIDYLFIKAY
ncbi:MAG: hypothetical protein IT249_19820 [Chitinophagaceae bacterium]|nr:hypothetical protein [Chitinophagaceae bacterium]